MMLKMTLTPINNHRSMKRWFVLVVVIIFWIFCNTAIIDATDDDDDDDRLQSQSQQQLYVDASDWLYTNLGISGLCHPTLDIYAPAFPLCNNRQNSSSSSSSIIHDHDELINDQPENNRPLQRRIALPSHHRRHQQQHQRHLEQQQQDEDDNYYNDYYYNKNRYIYNNYQQNDDDNNMSDDSVGNNNNNITYTKAYFIMNGCFAIICVIGGALAAGLTIGLMSLDPLLLVIKIRGGQTQQERQQALELLPLVKQHHQLLVTLLLLNTIAGEALPVFLQNLLLPDGIAILCSVILVLIFGEILPSALFTGPNQLQIASSLTPVVKLFMWLLYPIAYPIARLLDRIMHDNDHHDDCDGTDNGHVTSGGSGQVYSRNELAALIRIQYEERLMAKQRRKHQRKNTAMNAISDTDLIVEDNTTLHDIYINSDARQLQKELLQHQEQIYHHNQQQQQQQQQQMDNSNSNNSNTITHSNNSINNRNHNNNHNHQQHRRLLSTSDYSIDGDEVMIMEGALQMKTKKAIDIYISFHKVFCISYDMILNDTNIFTIYASGYSRVPVYINNNRRCIKGILMTRQLMVVKQQLTTTTTTTKNNPRRHNINDEEAAADHLDENDDDNENNNDIHKDDEHQIVADLNLHIPQCVAPNTNLVTLVNLFQQGGSAVRAGHMALVCARPDIANAALDNNEAVPEEAGLMGIITLEDVLEALLQEQIYDEMDHATGRTTTTSSTNNTNYNTPTSPSSVPHAIDIMEPLGEEVAFTQDYHLVT